MGAVTGGRPGLVLLSSDLGEGRALPPLAPVAVGFAVFLGLGPAGDDLFPFLGVPEPVADDGAPFPSVADVDFELLGLIIGRGGGFFFLVLANVGAKSYVTRILHPESNPN